MAGCVADVAAAVLGQHAAVDQIGLRPAARLDRIQGRHGRAVRHVSLAGENLHLRQGKPEVAASRWASRVTVRRTYRAVIGSKR